MFDYETLKIVWWVLVGVLLIGFAIMDGHDMGVGGLLPFVARTDVERRIAINSVGPHWDGNQVWFITAGGAIFAAWPLVYSAAFSGLYWAMLCVLWSLFFRPVGFDYRSKLEDPRWRSAWDWGLFAGGFLPPVLFGVAFGNLLQGVPFSFDERMVSTESGSFWQLLNPFALLSGVVSSSMILLQGATYLAHRTEGDIQGRTIRAATIAAAVLVATFAAAGLWVATGIEGYSLAGPVDGGSVLAPGAVPVVRRAGAWLDNYRRVPWMIVLPALTFVGAPLAAWLARVGRTGLAFVASSLAVTGVIATAGASMFPFVMPSSSAPAYSLTAWNAVSSRLTLEIMLWVAVVFVPVILLYTAWAYRVMRGKITPAYVREHEHSAY